MFAPILNWVLGPSHSRAIEGPLAAQAECITGSPDRREVLQEICDLLIGIPREDRPELVDQVAHRYASFVVDLPASEKSHDRAPYGLLDHSLQVARAATRELVRPGFRVSEDPAANYREQPIWAYSGFVLGLLHDVGKVLDLEVVLPGGGGVWNPFSEPLARFLTRAGRTSSDPETWHWTKGRGMNRHVWKTEALVPLVLPDRSVHFVGFRLPQLLQTFCEAYKTGREDWGRGPAGRVVAAVRRADRAHAAGDFSPGTEVEERDHLSPLPHTGEKLVPSTASQATRTNAEADQSDHSTVSPGGEPAKVFVPSPGHNGDHGQPTNSEKSVAQGRIEKAFQKVEGTAAPSRGLPERDRRIEIELQPSRLVESIQSWVRSGNFGRNSSRGELIVRPDHLWLRYPDAFINLLHGNGISWSNKVSERLISVLLKLPLVEPENPRSPIVYVYLEPRDEKSTTFVRFRSRDLLPEKELAGLGFWPYDMRIQPTAIPRHQELPFRQIQGGRS